MEYAVLATQIVLNEAWMDIMIDRTETSFNVLEFSMEQFLECGGSILTFGFTQTQGPIL